MKKEIIIYIIIALCYLSISAILIGLQVEQFIIVFATGLFYFFNEHTRKFALGFSLFTVYWIIFDYMKAFPNYLFNDVATSSLYEMDKLWFGCDVGGHSVTLNEYYLSNRTSILDVCSGLFYLCWVPVPMLFSLYLFLKHRDKFLEFILCWCVINIIGWIIYYTYPAAPPWYIQDYGFEVKLNTKGGAAGLLWFDEAIGVDLYKNMYAKSSVAFAAMPSLHSAYPIIPAYYAIKTKSYLLLPIFITIMLGIWFAAVYTSHHYILDVVAGIACGITGIVIFELVVMPARWFKICLAKYQNLVKR